MFFRIILLTIFFSINIKLSFHQLNNQKLLEVFNVNNSQILIKYNGRPLYINFTELRDGKTRIHINDVEDEEGILSSEEHGLDIATYEQKNHRKNNDKYILSATTVRNDNKKIKNYYSQFIFIILTICVIILVIILCLNWYFYKKNKKVEKNVRNFKKLESNTSTTTTSKISSLMDKKNAKSKCTSNSTALTLPISESETFYSSSSTNRMPKLLSVKIPEQKCIDDTLTLVSIKTLSDHNNLSAKSISTFINALVFFALETNEQESKNITLKSANLQSTQIPSEMLTEQYLKSSVPNSKAQVKSSPLKSKISQTVNIGTIKIDKTQDSEEEKNSKSDPPEDSSSNTIKSSDVDNVSSIHPSDLSTLATK